MVDDNLNIHLAKTNAQSTHDCLKDLTGALLSLLAEAGRERLANGDEAREPVISQSPHKSPEADGAIHHEDVAANDERTIVRNALLDDEGLVARVFRGVSERLRQAFKLNFVKRGDSFGSRRIGGLYHNRLFE